MIRMLFVIVFLAVLGGVGGYAFLELALSPEESSAFPNRSQVKRAVRELLQDELGRRGYKIDILVPGDRTEEDTWAARGSLKGNTGTLPFYGSVRTVCEDWANLSCWWLTRLVINGKEIPLKKAAKGAGIERQGEGLASGPEAAAAPGAVSAEIPPGRSTEAGGKQQQPMRKGRMAQAPQRPPEPRSWFVKTDRVNARSGPGTQYERLFAMPSTVPMRLIEKRNGWGRFAFQLTDDSENTAWISLNLVTQR